MLLHGTDLRSKDLSPDACAEAAAIVKHFLFATNLPLAHATQFVEAGVKLAKLVAATGRSEESRTIYTVCKSSTDSIGSIRKMIRTDKAIKWIQQSLDHVACQEALKLSSPTHQRDFRRVKAALKVDHFKLARASTKQSAVSEKASQNKPQKVLQKKRGIHATYASLGLVAYGKLLSDFHMKDLHEELTHRQVAYDQSKKKDGVTKKVDGIRALTALLRKHEMARAGGDKNHHDKAFKPLSPNAPFVIAH